MLDPGKLHELEEAGVDTQVLKELIALYPPAVQELIVDAVNSGRGFGFSTTPDDDVSPERKALVNRLWKGTKDGK